MRIRVKNYSSMRKLIELIRPFLVGKADQASIMLEFVSLAGAKGKISLQGRSELMNKIKELNQRGHIVA